MGKAGTQVYKPRSGGVNKNLMNYTKEQIQYQKDMNEELLHLFGYVEDGKEDNNTPFFDFEGKAKEENVKKIGAFKELNVKAMENSLAQIKKHGKNPPKDIHSAKDTDLPNEIKMIQTF